MKKILIIGGNQMLSKLLAKKISSSLDLEVETAHTFEEAKEKIQNENYFLNLVDIFLLDAPSEEILDFLLSNQQHIIVLTSSDDAKSLAQIIDKEILGYIYRESPTCIEQITHSIKLLQNYEKTKVVLALSRANERMEIKKLLNLRLFDVLVAAHGEEALKYLEDNVDVKLIICDAQMPVLDGFSLLTKVREKYDKSELAVILLSEKYETLEASLLRNSANEVITKPCSKELFNARLDRCLEYLEECKLLNVFSDLEPLTGAKNSAALKSEIEDYLRELKNEPANFAFAFLDIDNLHAINEEYGYSVGDLVIKATVKEVLNETKGKDIIGHFTSEKICIVMKHISQEKAIKILSNIRVHIKNKSILVNIDELYFTASIGVTFGDGTLKFEKLVAKANEALNKAKIEGKDRVEVAF